MEPKSSKSKLYSYSFIIAANKVINNFNKMPNRGVTLYDFSLLLYPVSTSI